MTGVNPGWNFHKYLISKTGEVLSFETKIEPDSKNLLQKFLSFYRKVNTHYLLEINFN